MTDIPSVDELISNSINEKKLKRKKKVIKVLSTLVFLFLLGFIIFFYITSDYSKLSKIRVYGNENIKEEYIKQSILDSSSGYVLLDFGLDISKELESNPLIKHIKLDYKRFNELDVFIEENRVLAYLNDLNSVLLENGKLYSFNDYQSISLKELIVVSGYQNELEYLKLKDVLSELKESTILLISEIIQEEKSYDKFYAKLIMYDGIIVYSSLNTLKVLDDYAAIRSALNPEHHCIAIDEIKSVPYSFSCLP